MRVVKWGREIRIVASLALLSAALGGTAARAQVEPSAYRGSDTLWVGADAAYVNASFPYQSGQHLAGVGGFADFNINVRLAIEASAHFLEFGGFESETESSYLAGPRYRFGRYGRFQPYAQGLFGVGKIHYPFSIGDAHYFDIAPGAGVNYRLSSRWQVRAEYEYQLWMNSPGYANEPDHQLRPNGVHIGIAFRPFR
jgi:opacity protein-like surface antigen